VDFRGDRDLPLDQIHDILIRYQLKPLYFFVDFNDGEGQLSKLNPGVPELTIILSFFTELALGQFYLSEYLK